MRLVIAVRLSAWSSLSQRLGKTGRLVRTVLGAPGLRERGGKWAAQLATRQLSWFGSINWRELPRPFAAAGQGDPVSYWTWATTTLFSGPLPGCTRVRVPPTGMGALKVSKMGMAP